MNTPWRAKDPDEERRAEALDNVDPPSMKPTRY